jgi:hypothetical protein
MSNSEDDDEFRRLSLKAAEGFAKTREWALSEELPTTAYNLRHGWTLDQFAMNFEPDLLIAFKRRLRDFHEGKEDPEDFGRLKHPLTIELENKIKKHLLENRYRITAFSPGSNSPEPISHALLEDMHPNIVLSELRELTVVSPRRFEKVRVFDDGFQTRSTGGRKPTYDWPALRCMLEEQQPHITEAELVEYCRRTVKPRPGKDVSRDGPDDKTVREAIDKYGLRKFIKTRA